LSLGIIQIKLATFEKRIAITLAAQKIISNVIPNFWKSFIITILLVTSANEKGAAA
jgi:hypothetical protein